jgi:SNF2 family DNA or RNA helicase
MNEDIQPQLQAYKQLDYISQSIVKIITTVGSPITVTTILELLSECGIRKPSGTKVYPVDVKPLMNHVISTGIFSFSSSGSFVLNSKLINLFFLELMDDSEFIKLSKDLIINKEENYYRRKFDKPESIRNIRLSILHNDFDLFFTTYRKADSDVPLYDYICDLFEFPAGESILERLSDNFKRQIIRYLYSRAISRNTSLNLYIEFIKKQNKNERENGILLLSMITHKGDVQDLTIAIEQYKTIIDTKPICAVLEFMKGNNSLALKLFYEDFKPYFTKKGIRNTVPTDISAVFFLLTLIKENTSESLKLFDDIVAAAIKNQTGYIKCFQIFQAYTFFRLNHIAIAKQKLMEIDKSKLMWLEFLAYSIVNYLCNTLDNSLKPLIVAKMDVGIESYWCLGVNLFEILKAAKYTFSNQQNNDIERIKSKTGMKPFFNVVEETEEWERMLQALTIIGKNKPTITVSKEKRLIWQVDFISFSVQPREQAVDKAGRWSEGRNVALKRLKEGGVECMTNQDHKIAASIYVEKFGYYGQEQYYFDREKCIKEMVGHPLLFSIKSPNPPIELVKAEPELIVEKNQEGFSIYFAHQFDKSGVHVTQETPTRYSMMEITNAHLIIKQTLGKNKLHVPKIAQERLMGVVSNLTSLVTIHSDIVENKTLHSIQADHRIYLHLMPMGNGIKTELFVKPFTTSPPYFKPGAGGKVVFATINKEKIQAIRNLKTEESEAQKLIAACPSLAEMDDIKGSLLFETPLDCLEFLEELEKVKDSVGIEWPEGEKIKIKYRLSFNNSFISINKSQDWFSISGNIKVDNQQVMEMKNLLSLIENNQGNFIPLGNGEFLSLTKEFRRRLDEINSFTEKSKDNIQFHQLASYALLDAFEDFDQLETDKKWKDHVKNIKKIAKQEPEIPPTFECDMRPYQIEGYNWLNRLSRWGVGACLADDMGLGKTIQAIAILLDRSSIGASLVLAPASVCSNWIHEILRFAPTLNAVFYADNRDILNYLEPATVLICSYGLLQSNIELFTAIKWNILILDEAQAIKNTATKRSQAVMELNAGFRLITTGTPIQNHLGELWNLFNFINPGLLGSLKTFNERFALPIEKNQDNSKKNQLKKLIQPFILRRTKNQVLDELPEKTEIVLSVELSPKEMAFYEALRQKAIEKLEGMQDDLERNHIQILAEITKLRRACCNPALVDPNTQIESSKLSAFSEIVDELIENKHKALVFSQFVGHLSIIRKHLDSKGIHYQYLDGSTPLKEREKSVKEFQSGVGDLFLISLKAGGLGLNLTAADYVVHLDPWWNPAVEDQASDRAHRIGQQPPVTIYKLITHNTIEEKIIHLHHNKRDLANSLLEGADMSAKVSADELFKLIKS